MDENIPQPPAHNTRNIIIGVVVLAVVIALLSFMPEKSQAPTTNNNTQTATDYASCALAGYPIEQTNPPTCTTPQGQTFTDQSAVTNQDVIITTPKIADIVTSPMTISGKVRGTWFFEANLPIELEDEDGNVLAQTGYHTDENWMTSDYVDVNTTLKFPAPTTDYGKLVIHNDNPSGDPANDKSFEVPVRFK
ncbi:MAG TPA: Gmad2 immunoglobulin-like domain-containing protein [Patescibacteria group bacterium]|nr:Gmad2 immunoglobulin-like domain-containing protein [Patescibacteria group bacterium]